MKIPTLFKEYIWLIETIYQAGRITLAEINEKWLRTKESGGVEFARTTFNRHRDAIFDIFGVIIECDRKDGYRYYIYNEKVLKDDSIANWLFSTLSVSNMMDENVGLQNRILLESIPSGDIHLKMIIKAMKEGRKMMVTYRRYGAASANSFAVAPYCVKLFKRRWYVLVRFDDRPSSRDNGNGDKEALSILSLDRIENIELLQEKFMMNPDFDAASFFKDCYGILVADGTKAERVVLRAYGLEQYYLCDLPLHHSQRVIGETEDYTDFELYLRPTNDFKAHLMSRGSWLQVISPEWLAKEMKEWYEAAMKRYLKEEKIEK